MKDTDISARLNAAVRLAHEAGAGIMRHFARWSDQRAIGLEIKADGSPVTLADREAERFIRDALAREFPRDGVLGEEFGETRGDSGYRWVIDPVDGTASFVMGVPLFGTLVGLEADGRPAAGVIHMPALDECVFGGPGLGATHRARGREDRAARVSSVSRVRDAAFVTTSYEYYIKAGRAPLFDTLSRAVRIGRGFSDAYAFLLVATGRADVCVEPGVKPWDVAAVAPVVEGAGGAWSDLAGARSINTGSVVATNGALHAEILALCAG